jgi:hypothetical protein
VELKRIRVSSVALRWILAVSLTASPLLAEYPPQSDVVAAQRPVVRLLDENNDPLVGSSLYSTVLMDSPAAAEGQFSTEKAGTELGAPRPAGMPGEKKAEPGGKTMSTLIIAALIAGGVIALILLLRGGDDKKVTTASHGVTSPPQETGTVLVPGTPTVGTPH